MPNKCKMVFILGMLLACFIISCWFIPYPTPTAGPSASIHSVQQTTDGGYILAGWIGEKYSDRDVYLIRTDATGEILWTKTYGGKREDVGYSVQQTSDGGYIIVGYTYSFGSGQEDVYLVKAHTQGDTIWTKTYGGTERDMGRSVRETSDGGYIIAGYTDSFGAGEADVYLVKTDASGDVLWTKTYGGTGPDNGRSVQETSDGGYIIAGITSSFSAADGDVYLIKTDVNGDALWTKTYGGSSNDRGNSAQQTSDGGYIIAGGTKSFGAGGSDVYLIKTDVNGDTLWTKTYGGSSNDGGSSVQQTSDGGYIITGYAESSEGCCYNDVYVIKTGTVGDTVWTKTYGGICNDVGYSVLQTSDGNYIFAGKTQIRLGNYNAYLIKTDAIGDIVWEKKY